MSGHGDGLHPVGASEAHGEDEAAGTGADPDGEPTRFDSPDDAARIPIEGDHLAAVGPDHDGVCAEQHPRVEDRLPDGGLPPCLAGACVDERDRPEVIA